ncbi:ESPR-type extended signal peptide-containing protein, partial [Escherichia sp. MR]|uniref:ESPR-type extended signal peptide-containing protein n=1 Tax=Escherichia sp. MR TaxID=2575922 RepID=UPI00265754F5
MNKIFKVIWNPATGSYSVASETAKSRGKKSGRSKLLISALVAGGLMSSFGTSASVGLDGGKSSEDVPVEDYWIAIGKGAKASSKTSSDGTPVTTASVAIGYLADASGIGGSAYGYQTKATGERSSAFGQGAEATGSRAIAIGSSSRTAGDYAIALGASASKLNSLAFGNASTADGDEAIAFGYESQANGLYSLALGSGSIANADNSVALGKAAQATKAGAMAFGQAGKADGVNSIALGNSSLAGNENSIAIGQKSSAGPENSIAIGGQTSVTGANSVALGTGSVAKLENSVSVGNDTLQRKIVNMAKGSIAKDSNDAINGSQLFDISKSIADRLGGGASVDTTGTGIVTAPSYQLQSGVFGNVGDALEGLDNNTLQWDSVKKAYSAAHGSDATSKITNIKDGDISATSKDAVNGSQLKTTNDNVATNTTNISNLTGDVANNTTNITNLTNDVAANTTNITNLTDTVTNLGEDTLKWDDTAGVFTAAHGTEATSKITNVTAGELTETSTDAVNGSQLKTTNDNVATNTTNITNLTGDVANNTTNITNLTDTVNSLGEDALKWDDAAGVFTAAHGTEATSKITNVTAGELT